jgi:hypothetical protein
MPAWVKRPALPLLLAALVFIALSLAARGPGRAWVVVKPVAQGAPIVSGDVRYEVIPRTFDPPAHSVARVTLSPGTVVGPGVVASGDPGAGDELTVAVSSVSEAGLSAGDRVRLGAAANGSVWLSPPVTVVDVSAGGVGALAGSLTITGPWATMLAVVQHDGNPSGTWLVLLVGRTR